jgi:hypothetical protein
VERSGAAQGLAEVLLVLGRPHVEALLPDILAACTAPSPFVREGHLTLFAFLPHAIPDIFQARACHSNPASGHWSPCSSYLPALLIRVRIIYRSVTGHSSSSALSEGASAAGFASLPISIITCEQGPGPCRDRVAVSQEHLGEILPAALDSLAHIDYRT